MLSGERVIAVVPARGGSKTVPGKNLRPLGGRPLVAWSIDAARRTPAIDRVIVSTDDEAIAQVAREHGAEVYGRPAALATDTALVIDALRDLAARLGAEGESATTMVLLEPTCPFRAPEDVSRVLELLARDDLDSVATFTEAKLNPHRAWRIEDHRPRVFIEGAVPWLPRQALPPAYQLNGAVYAFRIQQLAADTPALVTGRAGAIVMPRERSLDIDDALDFLVAELVLERNRT